MDTEGAALAGVRRERGKLFEDFTVGQVIEHHWGRTITSAESIAYSTVTMNYNPLYFDEVYARHLGYEGLVVNPLLAYTIVLGLSVEDLSEAGGPFLGVDDLEFIKTIYPGDTLRARSVTLNLRLSKSRPGWGIVEWKTSGVNQRGETVLEYRRRNLSKTRATEASP